jgi:hypothetical protein
MGVKTDENGNHAEAKTTAETTLLPPFVSLTPTRLSKSLINL